MDWTTIIVALIAASPGLWALRHQRLASDAGAAGEITDSALKLLEAQEQRVKQLTGQLEDAFRKIARLEEELKLQEIQIDNGQAQQLKTQLAYTIVCYQLRQLGYPPAVEPSELQSISIATLRERAEIIKSQTDRQTSPKDTLILK